MYSSPEYSDKRERHRAPSRVIAAVAATLMLAGGVGGYAVVHAQQSATTSGNTAAVSSSPSDPSASSSASANATGTATLTLAQIEAAVDPAIVDVTATLGSTGT